MLIDKLKELSTLPEWTELLTDKGWVELKYIKCGDLIVTGVVNTDSSISLTFEPVLYLMSGICDKIYNVDGFQCSYKHKILTTDMEGVIKRLNINNLNRLVTNVQQFMYTTGTIKCGYSNHLNITDQAIEFMVAFNEHGRMNNMCYELMFDINKDKVAIIRFENLLKNYDINYHSDICGGIVLYRINIKTVKGTINEGVKGYININRDKCCYKYDLLGMSHYQFTVFYDALIVYNSEATGIQCYINDMDNVNFIQALTSIHGVSSLNSFNHKLTFSANRLYAKPVCGDNVSVNPVGSSNIANVITSSQNILIRQKGNVYITTNGGVVIL